MTTTLCTSCGDPITVAENGRALTPRPTRIGLYDPTDGELLTARQINERINATDLAGHSPHQCAEGQGALFDTQEVG